MAHPNAEANTEDLGVNVEATDQDFEAFLDDEETIEIEQESTPEEPASAEEPESDVETEDDQDQNEQPEKEEEEPELQQEAIENKPQGWSNEDAAILQAEASPKVQEIIARREAERNAAFQQKTTEIANERKELNERDAQQKETIDALNAQILINQVGPEPQPPHPEYDNPNSRHYNPSLYDELLAKYNHDTQVRNQLIAQMNQRAEEFEQNEAKKQEEFIQERDATLEKTFPQWKDPIIQDNLCKFAETKGFNRDDVMKAPAAEIEILNDAMQYRALQDAKPKVTDQLKTKPNVQKPGAKPGKTSNVNQNMKLYKKTGDDSYVDKAFEEFM